MASEYHKKPTLIHGEDDPRHHPALVRAPGKRWRAKEAFTVGGRVEKQVFVLCWMWSLFNASDLSSSLWVTR